MTTPTNPRPPKTPTVPLAVWPVAQPTAQYHRAGRYLPGCTAPPGKMLPELARRIVTEYSTPGQVVLAPLAGIGTTLVEAALVDHGPLTVTPLDPTDTRQVTVEVAGLAALLVAKAHKIHDRLEGGRPDRLSDKDAADVYRIMQPVRPADLGATIAELLVDPRSSAVTGQAMAYTKDLFGRRAGDGVVMAQRALQLAVDPDQVAALCVAFTEGLA